ncbi:MAG: hypothetical protein AAGB32_06130 [Pseudomonadota bacterium]
MRLLLSFVFVLMMVTPAVAAASCYSAKEAEAEQGIRIHSELMVIGLNCQHMTPRGWKNFYQEYREITSRNKSLFSEYENILEAHYGGAKKLHNLRTNFANEVSTNAASMRPDVFCANFAPRIPQVGKMSRAQLQQWASSASKTERQSKPICN